MRTIAIFARWPLLGHAKTRLVPALTPEFAHRLHRAMLSDARDAALGASAGRRTLWWADAPRERDGLAIPRTIEVFDQATGDLGDRLADAFTKLHRAPGDRVITIGSDCPWLDGAAIDCAFDALERADVVLGPTDDGGFHLIGLTDQGVRTLPGLLQGISWSTERTRAETQDRVREAGLSVELLADAADVDTPSDLLACLRRAMRDRAGAAHTRAALEAMGLLPRAAG